METLAFGAGSNCGWLIFLGSTWGKGVGLTPDYVLSTYRGQRISQCSSEHMTARMESFFAKDKLCSIALAPEYSLPSSSLPTQMARSSAPLLP